jgi:hypothetical protein
MGNRTGEEIGVPRFIVFLGQVFSPPTDTGQLITHKSSESRNVDLANNGMGNHYLPPGSKRRRPWFPSCHRTVSLTYMSD